MTAAPRARAGDGLVVRAEAIFDAYRAGDLPRMGELVDLLTPILWHTARTQGLPSADAEDVVQTAWLKLIDRAESIQHSRAVLAWLMTTVRRDAIRQRHRRTAMELDVDRPPATTAEPDPEPAEVVVLDEREQVLWDNVGVLSERCQHLLRVIAFADRPDYATVAEALGMPIGSIGPTRGRCLAKLRELLDHDTRWDSHVR